MTRNRTTKLHRALLAWTAATLMGCGGGGGGISGGNGSAVSAPTPGSDGTASVPAGSGSVAVTVLDTSGRPLADAEVHLSSNGEGLTRSSDSSGRVTFAGIPAGQGRIHVSVHRDGYFSQSLRDLAVRDKTSTDLAVWLESLARATPVLLGARGKPSADGTRLRVEVDVAVLDERGENIETLTVSDFELVGEPCGWGRPCLYSPNGDQLPGQIHYDHPATPALVERAIDRDAGTASSTALLLEESEAMASRDPRGVRYAAVDSLLAATFAPHQVALGSYRAASDRPLLAIHGDFSSDGSSLRPSLDALRGHASGPNPVFTAVTSMLDFATARAPSATQVARINLVAFISDGSIADSEGDWPSYGGRLGALVERALAGGVRMLVIGSGNAWNNGNGLAVLAMLTGGLHVDAAHPVQLAAITPRLPDLLARRVGFQRLHFELHSSGPGVFKAGNVADVAMSIRVGAGLTCYLDLPIPIH